MNVWVIGSQGLLGSALLDCCLQKGIQAVGTSHGEADICNLEQLRDKVNEIKPTHIINCAAYTNVDGAEKDSKSAFAVNCEGAANAASVAKEYGARFIHISTDFVFDGKGDRPYREEDTCAPINEYGKSKWEGEKKVLEIMPTACIIRTSWVFGSRGKNFICSLLGWFQEREQLQMVSDHKGKPTYSVDLAEAVTRLFNAEGIVHFANSGEVSRYQIAMDLWEAMKQKGIEIKCQSIQPVPSSQFQAIAERPSYSALDTSKYVSMTSFKPRPWLEAASEFLDGTFKV